jgi:hypothetical protein
MEQNNKLFFLFQTTVSFFILQILIMSVIWAWAVLFKNEPNGRKGSGINLKEF